MNFFDKRYTQIDEKLMQDGAEVDFGDGFFVTVRHVSAEKVSMERGKITQRVKVMSRNKELTPEQHKIITSHVAAHGGIVGWRGGDVPEFTPAFAEEVFKQRPEFLEDIIFAMTTFETFRAAEVEAAVGNLPQS
jgi:hypothetical protein